MSYVSKIDLVAFKGTIREYANGSSISPESLLNLINTECKPKAKLDDFMPVFVKKKLIRNQKYRNKLKNVSKRKDVVVRSSEKPIVKIVAETQFVSPVVSGKSTKVTYDKYTVAERVLNELKRTGN